MKRTNSKTTSKQQVLDFSSSKKFAARNAAKAVQQKVDVSAHASVETKQKDLLQEVQKVLQPTSPKSENVVETEAWIKKELANREELIEKLKQFDLDSKFGNNVGMTRLQRWNRAKKLNLSPPEHLGSILQAKEVQEDAELREALWAKLL
ncbi:hypothetical protein HDU97_002940 [Phlyctochytrium planicorne]|nr:hypothetical protein HDU97_002940 [Phlyctochytrium planicorne]